MTTGCTSVQDGSLLQDERHASEHCCTVKTRGEEGECVPSEKGRVTFWLVFTTLVTSVLGSCQYGYQLGMLTGPSKRMQQFYNESIYDRRGVYLGKLAQLWLWSTLLSILCIGGGIGAFASGRIADRLGRKRTIWLVNISSIIGGSLMAFSYLSQSYTMAIIGRFLNGFYVGVGITIIPVYLAEISPVNLRGAIGMSHQFMIAVGIAASEALGLLVFDYDTGWPILLSIPALLSLIQLLIFPFCPESPRWLYIRKRREDEAEEVLKKLRGTDDVSAELVYLRSEAEKNQELRKVSMMQLLRLEDPLWKKPLIITVLVPVLQQFSGLNAVLFYATEIFYQTGLDKTEVDYSTVGLGAIMVVMTVVALFVVDSGGRRPLLIYPYAIMGLCTALLTLSLNLQEHGDGWKWFSLVLIYAYMTAFALGPGPVAYVLLPELWTQGPRSVAMSIAMQAKWLANFVIGLAFPFLQDSLGPYAFLVFCASCVVMSAFIFFYAPETKGRTFEDIAAEFAGHRMVPNRNHGEDEDQTGSSQGNLLTNAICHDTSV